MDPGRNGRSWAGSLVALALGLLAALLLAGAVSVASAPPAEASHGGNGWSGVMKATWHDQGTSPYYDNTTITETNESTYTLDGKVEWGGYENGEWGQPASWEASYSYTEESPRPDVCERSETGSGSGKSAPGRLAWINFGNGDEYSLWADAYYTSGYSTTWVDSCGETGTGQEWARTFDPNIFCSDPQNVPLRHPDGKDALELSGKRTCTGGGRYSFQTRTFTFEWQLTRLPDADHDGVPDAKDVSDDFGLPRNGNPSSVGDPINLTTGNAYDYKQDLFVPGRGVPLQFVRFYNSQDSYSGPLGHGWTHVYNTSLEENEDGSVTEMDPQGARLTFFRNPDGSYASPMGIHDTLTRDSSDAFELRKKNGMEWRFDSSGKLQEIADPNGNALSFSYDADGRLQKITNAVGRDTTLAYDSSGLITGITDPAGREVLYGYSAEGDLTSVTDPSGSVTRYEYDASNNLTRITNPKGGTTTFAYDSRDRAVSVQSDGEYQKTTLDYQPEEGRTLVTDSKGNESAFHYDVVQRVTKIVDPYGEEIRYGWDTEGNRTSVTDQLGNTTSYEYDDRDNLTKVVQPKPTTQATNPTTTLTYETDFNRVTSVTDPEEGATRHAYDENGNLTETTDAAGDKATFEYDANGQLTKSTDPKGNATTYAYDDAGNPTGITDPAGKTTGLSYADADSLESLLGLPSSLTDPLGRDTTFSYDALGRVTRTTNPDDSTASTSYDAMGNVTGVTDERGDTWSSTYDDLGRLSSETDPLGMEDPLRVRHRRQPHRPHGPGGHQNHLRLRQGPAPPHGEHSRWRHR